MTIIWKVVGIIGTIIGILYIWPDVAGLPKAYGYKWGFPMWLDREFLAYFFLGLALAWVAWIEVRPSMLMWWRHRRRPPLEFICNDSIPCLLHDAFRDSANDLLVRTTRRVGIRNNTVNKTFRGVTVRLEGLYDSHDTTISLDAELPAPMRPFNSPSSVSVNLRPGETEYWDIAKWFENQDTKEGSGIFVCCFDKAKRHYVNQDLYKANLAVYSENDPRIEASYCLGGSGALLMVPWDQWMRNFVKAVAEDRDFVQQPNHSSAEQNDTPQLQDTE